MIILIILSGVILDLMLCVDLVGLCIIYYDDVIGECIELFVVILVNWVVKIGNLLCDELVVGFVS